MSTKRQSRKKREPATQVLRSASYTAELRRFAALFKTEADLREQIANLLTHVNGVTGVRITHGAQETGKDVVFFAPSGLEDKVLHACVIKNLPLSGSASSNQGARTVLIQAEQALDTPYVDQNGKEHRVSKAYIITPYECTAATISSILGKLHSNSTRVQFLSGLDLLQKFRDQWPDFLAVEGGFLDWYIAAIKRVVEKDAELTNIAFQHSYLSVPPLTLQSRYVRPHFRVVLRKFKLELQAPPASAFDIAITRRTLLNHQHNVELLLALLRNVSFKQAVRRTISSSEIDGLIADVETLIHDISSAWTAAFRRKAPRGLSPKVADSSIKVSLEQPKLSDKWKQTMHGVDLALRAFDQVVRKANTHAASPVRHPDQWLSSAETVSYFCVSDVSQLLASCVVQWDIAQTLDLDSRLLDSTTRPLLITGAAGYRKTSFCRWNTLNDINDLSADPGGRLPIYIALHRVAQGPLESFEQLLHLGALDDLGPLGVETGELLSRKLRLYLDGLDEVPSVARQREIIEFAREKVAQLPNMQVVVTGRDHVHGPWLHWLQRVSISEFSSAEVDEFVDKWLQHDNSNVKKFNDQLAKVPNIVPLLRVPLLASLILSVYRKVEQLPDSKVRLYDLFVGLLCGGWDDAKRVQRQGQFGPEIKKQVLTRVAGTLQQSKKRECTDEEFRRAIAGVAPKLATKWTDLLEDLIKDGLLLPTGSWYGFAHLSFQEYLAAKDLLDSTGNDATIRLRWYLEGDDWWKEVLAFYVGMLQNPESAQNWIRDTKREVKRSLADRNAHTTYVNSRAKFLLERMLETFTAFELAAEPEFVGDDLEAGRSRG
jgi:hypothetical protein